MPDRLPIPFVGVRRHENRTPTGRRTSAPARRAALYFAYGRDKEAQVEGRQRGEWLGPDGRSHSHETVLAWTKQEALRHRYTFEAILSTPYGELTAAAFCRAMQQGREIGDWRLMMHCDTAYRHAHVLFFRDQRLDKETLLAWQAEVRAELVRLAQQPAAAALGASQGEGMPHETGTSRTLVQEVGLGW